MYKVGIVGYGSMGHLHAECWKGLSDAKITALADLEPERRNEAKEKLGCEVYDNFDQLLASDVDIIDICTPTYEHEKMAVAALGAGKHVLCEKPMALSVDECDRMIAASKDAKGIFMIAHVIRFWPEYQVIKELVDSGKYGKVQWVSARRLSPVASFAWQNWFADPARSGGAVLDLHIHDQDYINYLLGLPKSIDARGTANSQGGIDSVFSLGSSHASGANSYAEGSLALAPGFPFTMSLLVACDQATIKYDSGASPTLMVYPTDGSESFAPELPNPGVGASKEAIGNVSALGGYFIEIRYFLDCIMSGKKPDIVTPESAREAVHVCLAARESAQTGKVVEL